MLLRSFLLGLVPAVLAENVCTDQDCNELAQQIGVGLNSQINPCDDFYGFVCGGERTRVDMTSQMVDILNRYRPGNVPEEQAQIFYQSCIQQSLPAETKSNFAALNRMVQDLGGWRDDGNLSNFDDIMQRVHQKYQVEVFFSWKVTQDLESPAKTIATISLDNLSADILLKPSDPIDRFSEFALQLSHMWNRGIQGVKAPTMRLPMEEITELHKRLQIRPLQTEATRKVQMTDLNQQAAFLDWERFFGIAYESVGLPIHPQKELVQVEYPETLLAVASVVREYMDDPPKRRLLTQYIILRALFEMSQNLATADENLEARCIDEGFTELTPIFNAIFVKETMLPDVMVREDVTRMYFILKEALLEILPELTRLNGSAVSYLSRELGKVHFFAGYVNSTFDDDHFARKYAGLNLGNSFIENKIRIREFNKRQNVAHPPRYGAEDFLDRFRVTEVNAFYSKKRNSVYLPAGLMRKPFFEVNYPDYVKYGALGAILSHELTHALMAHLVNVVPRGSGSSPAEAVFRDRAKCFESQYASYGNKSLQIDGVATLEENIGDNIGLPLALRAYEAQGSKGALLPKLNFTREQLFFISYAHSFCERPEESDSQALLSDVHVPDAIRIRGVLSNNVNFSSAFRCEKNRNLNPELRCNSW